jgi:hypothetical protein
VRAPPHQRRDSTEHVTTAGGSSRPPARDSRERGGV